MIAIVRRFLVTAVVALVGALALSPPISYADQVPFTDPNAKGYIGLCDKNNKNITSGSIHAAPFIWKAVSSTSPPANFVGNGENAILNIYQPRPGVDPAYWNGDSLTSASFYHNAKLPAAQATSADIPLAVIVNEYPAMMNGLYQLRMYYGRAGYGLYSSAYPAAVIRVSGDSWTLVQGGTVDCAAAPAVSNEILAGAVTQAAAGNPSGSKSSAASAPRGAPQTAPTTGNHLPPGSHPSGSGARQASRAGSPAQTQAASATRHASSSSDAAAIGAVVAAAVAVAGVAATLWYWRRRRAGPE